MKLKVYHGIEFNFHSNREDMSFNYYISQPKAMLETLLIKKY